MPKEQRNLDDGDYNSMDENKLIILSHIYVLYSIRVAVHYLRLQEGDVQSVLEKAGAIVATSDLPTLRRLSGDSETVTRHFIDWKFRRMAIEAILGRRLKQLSFSSDLADFEEGRLGDKWIYDLVKTIFNAGGRKAAVSWENWQDRQDMELLAVDAAVNAHNHISGQYSVTPPRTKLPALPADLDLPVNDPEPYNRIIPEWFMRHLGEALRKWAPIFEEIIETEGVKTARREVERVSRAERRRREHSDGTAESGLNSEGRAEGEIISSIAPTDRIPQPDEYTERRSNNDAIRRAIDRVVEQVPTAQKYFDTLAGDKDITKQEAALSIGRDPSMGRRYQERLKNELIREGVMPQPVEKASKKHPTNKK